jgi:hypothetical protein
MDKSEKVTLDDLLSAKLEISQAISFFSRFKSLPAKVRDTYGLKQDKVDAHEAFCRQTREQTDRLIADEQEKLRRRQVCWWQTFMPIDSGRKE